MKKSLFFPFLFPTNIQKRTSSWVLVFLLCVAQLATAQDIVNTWTAAAGTADWHTPRNWSLNQVPTFDHVVSIGGGVATTGPRISTGNAEARAVQLAGSSGLMALTVEATGVLTIRGNVIQNGILRSVFVRDNSFVNRGTIRITNETNSTVEGIFVAGDGQFINHVGATLSIDNVSGNALSVFNSGATFTNLGSVLLGANSGSGNLIAGVSAKFDNGACGLLSVNNGIVETQTGATFDNAGLLTLSGNASMNSNISSNTGLVQNTSTSKLTIPVGLQPISALVMAPSDCPSLSNGSVIMQNLEANTAYTITIDNGSTPQILTSNANGQLLVQNLGLGNNFTLQKACWPQAVDARVKVEKATLISSNVFTRAATCADGGVLIVGTNMGFTGTESTYSATYKRNGVTQTGNVTVSKNDFGVTGIVCTFNNLAEGTYSDIKVQYGGCEVDFAGPVYIGGAFSPVNSSITQPTACNATDSRVDFNVGSTPLGSYALTYKKNGVAQNTTVNVVAAGRRRMFNLAGLGAGEYTDFELTGATCTSTYSLKILIGDLPNPAISGTKAATTATSNDGSISFTGLAATKSYSVGYQKDGAAAVTTTLSSDASGNLSIPNLGGGTYTNIILTINSCSSNPFSATVASPQALIIAGIPDQMVCEGQTLNNVVINVTGDADGLSLTASSSNTAITPTFTFGGSGANRTLTMSTTAGQVGTTTITVTAINSQGGRATATFTFTINATPAAPTASAQSFCGTATVANLVATGTGLKWYASATGGEPLATTTELTSGTYYVSQTVNGCESTRTSVAVTLNATTSAPTALAQSFCGTSATVANLVATGTALKWYAAETGGEALLTTTSLATGTYYVSQTLNGCESTRTAVSVTVNAVPTAPTASAQSFCGTSATVANLVATGTALKWYATATGGEALLTTTSLATGTYYVSQTVNGCESTRTSVAVTLNATTSAPTALAQSFSGTSATVANLVATGTALKWYAAETGGEALLTTTSLATGTYYVSQTLNGCESTRTAVSVTVNAVPTAPTASAQSFCGTSATVANLVATGTALKWYATATGGEALLTTTSLATGTYYVSQTVNGCESTRTSVAVTLNATTSAPIATAQSFCGTATVANLVATGTALKWYATATGGEALLTTTSLATGTYYVSQTVNGCESTRTSVAVTLNATTSAPIATAQSFCGTATVANLVATGTGLKWYASATGGEPLATTTELTSGTYYVSQTVEGCESSRTAVSISSNTTTPAPTATAQRFCGTATVANLVATGTGLKWYASATGGEPLATTTELTSGTYFVSQTVNGCESTRTSVVVTLNEATLPPTASAQSLCGVSMVSNLVATGSNLKWYTSSMGGEALATTATISTGTYYVSLTINTCESVRTTVEVTVNTQPITLSTSTFSSPSTCTSVDGGISFSTSLPNGSYDLSYTVNGESQKKTVVVAGGMFGLSNLKAGIYGGFTVTFNGCTGQVAGPIELKDPTVVSGTVNGSTTLISGINSGALILTGHSGQITKWQSSTKADFSQVLDHAITAARFEITNLSETRFYRAVVEGLGCPPVFSTVGSMTVVQNQAPIASCKNITKEVDNLCSASVSAEELDNGSFDPEGGALVVSVERMGPFSVGQHPLQMTFRDPNGLTSQCFATLTVVDRMAPWIVTKTAEIFLDANGRAVLTASQVDAGSSDNCGIRSIEINKTIFTCSDVGTSKVTLIVTDLSGNQSFAEATVFVQDLRPPVAVTNAQTVYLNAQGKGSLDVPAFSRGSIDNCGIADVSVNIGDLGCEHLGSQLFTLTVRDLVGNITRLDGQVTVLDTIAPRIRMQNVVLFADGNGQATLTVARSNAQIEEACGVQSIEFSQTDFSCGTMERPVVISVRDRQGNVGFARFLVTVRDTLAPVLRTRPITVFLNSEGQAEITASQVDAGTSDNCGLENIVLSQTRFTCTDVGIKEVMFTATDRSGNVSRSTVAISVRDTLAPVVRVKPATVFLNAQGLGQIAVADIEAGTRDACGIASQVIAQTTFGCGELGLRRVLYTVTDIHGNSASVSLEVTVRDTIAPLLTTKPITLTLTEDGGAVLTADQVIETATDNCQVTAREVSRGSFNCSAVGMNTVVVTVRDASGNQTQRRVQVEVVDVNGVCPCSYAILASEEVELVNSTVNFGGVGAYGANGRVTIQNSRLNKANVLVRGSQLNVDASSMPDRQIQRRAPDPFTFEEGTGGIKGTLRVKSNSTLTASEGQYGTIRIKRGATLTLTEARVDMKKIVISKGGRLNFTQKTVLHVDQQVKTRDDVQFNATSQSVKVFAGRDLVFGGKNQLNGYFHTLREASFERNRGDEQTLVQGTIVGQRVRAMGGVTWDGGIVPCQQDAEEDDTQGSVPFVAESPNEVLTTESHLIGEGNGMMFRFGPNPTFDYVTLYFFETPVVKPVIRLTNVSGRVVTDLVAQEWVSNQVVRLKVDKLTGGSYLLSVQFGAKVETVKLMKE